MTTDANAAPAVVVWLLIAETLVVLFLVLREVAESVRNCAHRLYRATHSTFEAYCRERWGFVASRARQLIDSAKASARDVGI